MVFTLAEIGVIFEAKKRSEAVINVNIEYKPYDIDTAICFPGHLANSLAR